MRKLLSLLLVAVMLLSTLVLTSCDFMNTVEGFINDILGKEEEIRYTITEEEWNEMLKISNYTFKAETQGISIVIASAGSLLRYETDYPEIPEYSQAIAVDFANKVLITRYPDGTWTGQNFDESLTEITEVTLDTIGYFEDVVYADLVYEEATKSYTYKDETTIYSFKFENGVLVLGEMLPVDTTIDAQMTISDIGTTKVEIPEYQLAQ